MQKMFLTNDYCIDSRVPCPYRSLDNLCVFVAGSVFKRQCGLTEEKNAFTEKIKTINISSSATPTRKRGSVK